MKNSLNAVLKNCIPYSSLLTKRMIFGRTLQMLEQDNRPLDLRCGRLVVVVVVSTAATAQTFPHFQRINYLYNNDFVLYSGDKT
jgi:hypothetical protein